MTGQQLYNMYRAQKIAVQHTDVSIFERLTNEDVALWEAIARDVHAEYTVNIGAISAPTFIRK